MKLQKYQLIERCTQDDYSEGTPRLILKQVYFDGETLRATDGYKAVECKELRAKVAELEAQAKQQRGKWCDPVKPMDTKRHELHICLPDCKLCNPVTNE